jgi:hypothetical protein
MAWAVRACEWDACMHGANMQFYITIGCACNYGIIILCNITQIYITIGCAHNYTIKIAACMWYNMQFDLGKNRAKNLKVGLGGLRRKIDGICQNNEIFQNRCSVLAARDLAP